MQCQHLDRGSVPNRDPFARYWRDIVTYYADLLPKADGLANGEEGTYPTFAYQANYIKGLKRDPANVGDDADTGAYCDYLAILREARRRTSNRFDEINLQGDEKPPAGLNCKADSRRPRKQTNPQGGLPVSIGGPDPSGVNLNLFRNNVRSLRPAPRIDGAAPTGGLTRPHENTAEIVELYWMALLRDLPFRRWAQPSPNNRLPKPPKDAGRDWSGLEADGATIEAAVQDLNSVQPYFAEPYPVDGGNVTTANVFRGAAYGDQFGPYISQFLLRGNTVRCAQSVHIRHYPNEGMIPEGSVPNSQRQATVERYVDFLRAVGHWRCVEQGFVDPSGTDPIECEETDINDRPVGKQGRFIRNLRDLGNWVHLDDPAQHFRNAALLMLNEPELAPAGTAPTFGRTALDSFSFHRDAKGDAKATDCQPAGRPFRFAACNPYTPAKNPGTGNKNDDAGTQIGFVTFGPEHVLDAIGEVTDLALRAAWWHKWFVHRRLRPEEFGGLVDGWLRGGRSYAVDDLLRQFVQAPAGSGRAKGLLQLVEARNGFTDPAAGGDVAGGATYLLPQIFPEGSPTHPSYPSGHATIAGACATLLKAFFDTERLMTCPTAPEADPTQLPPAYVASDDGLRLEKASENQQALTVGGELDKLASNIAVGRNAAGVHWRSDATQGMELGEAVTAYFLYELAWALNEEAFCFSFRRFFEPEQVTILRQTQYLPGQEVRSVTWNVQPLGANGRPTGNPQTLMRTRTVDLP